MLENILEAVVRYCVGYTAFLFFFSFRFSWAMRSMPLRRVMAADSKSSLEEEDPELLRLLGAVLDIPGAILFLFLRGLSSSGPTILGGEVSGAVLPPLPSSQDSCLPLGRTLPELPCGIPVIIQFRQC